MIRNLGPLLWSPHAHRVCLHLHRGRQTYRNKPMYNLQDSPCKYYYIPISSLQILLVIFLTQDLLIKYTPIPSVYPVRTFPAKLPTQRMRLSACMRLPVCGTSRRPRKRRFLGRSVATEGSTLLGARCFTTAIGRKGRLTTVAGCVFSGFGFLRSLFFMILRNYMGLVGY